MRRLAAIAVAKGVALLSRRLRLGGGTALPGLAAALMEPGIVREMAGRLGQGSVLVTGTNGKTTTARLLRGILEAAGLVPVANRAGSNLMRGLAAALVEAAEFTGGYRDGERCVGTFEVDEATLSQAAAAVRPRAVVFTNLFRDQLDRYGEVEHVAGLWRRALRSLSGETRVVLNADDPSLAALAAEARGRVLFYGLEGASCALGGLEHAADARWCAACGEELAYRAVFYGHLGHWRCPRCGLARPRPQVWAAGVEGAWEGLRFSVSLPGGQVTVALPLVGLYNAYNVLAAVAGAVALGIGPAAVERGLASFTAAFGRQERLSVDGREVQVILAKNPAGLNQVLRTITARDEPLDLVLFLNDNIADGRDVSWIWDVDFEMLAGKARSLVVSGRRGWDMALRLKYAGVAEAPPVESDPSAALRRALASVPRGGTLYVIPTYTAMLQVRELLARWGGQASFWREG